MASWSPYGPSPQSRWEAGVRHGRRRHAELLERYRSGGFDKLFASIGMRRSTGMSAATRSLVAAYSSPATPGEASEGAETLRTRLPQSRCTVRGSFGVGTADLGGSGPQRRGPVAFADWTWAE